MSTPLNLTASLLAVAGIKAEEPKRASSLRLKEDFPNIDPRLQALIGDPDQQHTSIFTQTDPDVGHNMLANPLSPVQGDEIFFTGLIPGARFEDLSGQWWDIEDYDFEGKVRVSNPWRPRQTVTTSVDVIRKCIHSWLEPVLQRVPPAPANADYGVIDVRIVE